MFSNSNGCAKHAAHVNCRAADVHGVVRIRWLDVQFEDVVDIRGVYLQTA